MSTHEITIRVRYTECDPMGVAHHTAFAVWLEMGRTELLRQCGTTYRAVEADGALLAVTTLEIRYHAPARYDDIVTVATTLEKMTRAKVEHSYRVERDGVRLATARTVLACLDREGRPRPLPESITTPR